MVAGTLAPFACVNLCPNPSEQGGGSSPTPGEREQEHGAGADCGVPAPSTECCCFQLLTLFWAHWLYLALHVYCTFSLLNYS